MLSSQEQLTGESEGRDTGVANTAWLGGNPQIQGLWVPCCEDTMLVPRASNPGTKTESSPGNPQWLDTDAAHLGFLQLAPRALSQENTDASDSLSPLSAQDGGKSLLHFQVLSMSSPSL